MKNPSLPFAHKFKYIACLMLCLPALAFSLFFLFHDYEYLSHWFFSLNDCFYRSAYWQQDFFTERVKSAGNRFCIPALLISGGMSAYALFRISKKVKKTLRTHVAVNSGEWVSHGLLALSGIVLWMYSNAATRPAYDEIFSAVHSAGAHPFQALSYYMAPNNHVLFNVLNSVLFFSIEDKLWSGRLLSLAGFLVMQQIAFLLLKQKMPLAFAFGAALLLSLTLPTLGFAAQARGYSLHLAAGWVTLLALYQYLKTGHSAWTAWLALGIFTGYATLPSFLYYHGALVGFGVCWQTYHRKIDVVFWKYQLAAIGLVFLFYLPALSFSGLGAFTENKWVKIEDKSLQEFLPQFTGLFRFFMHYGLSGLFEKSTPALYLLYLLPVGLFFSKNKEQRAIAGFYLLLWGAVIITVIGMKKIPFSRNLIIQYSIGLSIIAYTLYMVFAAGARRLKKESLKPLLYFAVIVGLVIGLLLRFPRLAGEQLYFNRANDLYEMHRRDMAAHLPPDATTAFSDQSFYWYYLCRKNGYRVHLCAQGDETYFVKRISEPLPESVIAGFETVVLLESDGYEILKRK